MVQKGLHRRAFLPALLLGLAALCAAAPAPAADTAKPQTDAPLKLKKIESDLNAADEKRAALEAEIETLNKERKSLAQTLVDVAARIQSHEAHLTATENRLEKLGLEDRILRDRLGQRRAVLSSLLSSLQKLEQHPPPALVVKPGDVLGAIRSAMLLSKIVPEIRAEANKLSRELVRLVRLREEIKGEKQRLEENSRELEKERQRIANLLELKKQLANTTREEVSAQRKIARKLSRDARNLKDLIARLEKQSKLAAEAKRLADQKTAEATAKSVAKPTRVSLLAPSRIKPAQPFAKTRGKLPFPAQGLKVRLFGEQEAGGGAAKGVTIQTRKQAQVISPSDGWVVYAGSFRGYGQLLIVDGGNGYHVLLAGMDRISVDVNQFVLAGEPVGTMGDFAARSAALASSEQQTEPLLYVEFRKEGISIDPDPWWSGNAERVNG
ncbi:MAG: hypothetical protein C0605_10060 [Hyphomicrobiales bacterium]|nr:MAG: hypothetical protein C0605_10060 [Hyphomicrobiales bacterium]